MAAIGIIWMAFDRSSGRNVRVYVTNVRVYVTNVRVYVTNQRVVVIADRDPAKIRPGDDRRWWALHFRHERISEFGMIENTMVKKAGFRQRVVGSELHETPSVRLALPSGSINEISFHATNSSTPGGAEFIAPPRAGLGPRVSASESKANAEEVPFGTRGRRFWCANDAIPTPFRKRWCSGVGLGLQHPRDLFT